MSCDISFEGKVAVVTGSAQGIGKAIASAYAKHGARIVISDVQCDKGKAVANELGAGAFFHACDVSKPDQALSLVNAAVEQFGRLDVLVNNAARNPAKPEERVTVDEYPEDIFANVIDVDVNGTFYCSKTAARQMIKQGSGSIINIASIAGVVALRLQIAHVTAKAAIIRMTEAMALELGPRGIRVNAISPGSTVTEHTREIFYGEDARFKEFRERLLSFVPQGRPGEAGEIAQAALFLSSDLAAYINGHNLVVDGGWSCGHIRDF
ncbi:MAG TPA: SDR family oxidoreductase [Candidatus Hydrogenedentes bacterium]|nr:SDR family oxidoreductase [Candidatus Hydrogenedentota bacterium]